MSIRKELYSDLCEVKEEYGLDFDDAYQFKIAEGYGFSIVTQDKDFEKVSTKVNITFL